MNLKFKTNYNSQVIKLKIKAAKFNKTMIAKIYKINKFNIKNNTIKK